MLSWNKSPGGKWWTQRNGFDRLRSKLLENSTVLLLISSKTSYHVGKTFTRILKILIKIRKYGPFINIVPIILGASLNEIRILTTLRSRISFPSTSASISHVRVLYQLLARIWHLLILKKWIIMKRLQHSLPFR